MSISPNLLSSELSGTRSSTVNGTVPGPTTHPGRPTRFDPRDSTRWAAPASACRVLNSSEERCHVALKPTITTERPDELWGTDMTTTVTTEEGQVCVFVAVDHCTAECIGIHASLSGNRFEALEPLRQGVRELFGGFDQGIAAGLAIRHDHGSACHS